MSTLPIAVPSDLIAEFCRRNHIRTLSYFGSVLTSRFRPESDVDMLVKFEEDARPTLLTMARLERELSDLIGRKVDLLTAGDLSRYFRNEVVGTACRNMNEADRIRVRHMLDAAEKAILIAQVRSRTSLLAVMKDIEIIGEAANKASAALRVAEPTIPSRTELVWDTATSDLPVLVLQLRDLLAR